jgi:hypothetical protein
MPQLLQGVGGVCSPWSPRVTGALVECCGRLRLAALLLHGREVGVGREGKKTKIAGSPGSKQTHSHPVEKRPTSARYCTLLAARDRRRIRGWWIRWKRWGARMTAMV